MCTGRVDTRGQRKPPGFRCQLQEVELVTYHIMGRQRDRARYRPI